VVGYHRNYKTHLIGLTCNTMLIAYTLNSAFHPSGVGKKSSYPCIYMNVEGDCQGLTIRYVRGRVKKTCDL